MPVDLEEAGLSLKSHLCPCSVLVKWLNPLKLSFSKRSMIKPASKCKGKGQKNTQKKN